MSPSDANTRRERGVLAQREYRKRHASKVQKLQDENKKLKDIIGDINKALERQGQLSEDLRTALSKARDLAGISSSTSSGDEASTGNDSSSGQQTEPLDPAIEEIIRLDPTIAGELVPSGRLSPRLDYGLWIDPDRIIRILEPPVDIVPYLGSGMNTLAGCIFWSTMNYTIDLWNSRTTPLSTKYLDRMFNHSKHLTDRQFLLSLAQARVDYKDKGFMYKKLSEQFERNAVNELYQRIKAEYEMQGQPSRWWKRPEEVADTVLSMLGDPLRDRFQAVVDGHGTKDDAELLRPLITWLAQNFICFGDGPRWSSVFVSVAVGSWLNETKRREGLEA